MTRRRITLALPILLLVLASAAPTATAAKRTEEHCVFHLVPISVDDVTSTIDAVLQESGCFTTFEEAVAAGTGTDVTGLSLEGAGLTSEMLAAADEIPGNGDVLIGIEYNQLGYEGSSFSYYATAGCASTAWQVSFVGTTWNNLFESGKGFGACDRNRKFAGSNFIGDSILCMPNCSNYGSLRNDVSSLKWRAD